MKKVNLSIVFGIIAGIIISIAWYAFAKSMGFYTIEVYKYRNYLVLALLLIGVSVSIYFAKRKNNGFLEYKAALKSGMLYSLVLAIVLAIFNSIYYKIIAPDTIDYFLSEAKKALLAHGTKLEEIPKYLDAERDNFGSFKLIPPTLFFGLVTSLLAGLVFQKKDPHTFSAN